VWKGIDLEPKPPVLAKSVEEQNQTFQLPPGYVMEPVLTDPQIDQPGAINFDANGRLLVLELRSYMLTADADRELEPTSVISRWEDLDNDGVYETGGIFVDSLIFPRFVMPWGINSVLTMDSNQDNVYLYTDTDGDGKADKKEFFTGDFGRSGNVEHQQSFLYYGMDNWMYSTYNTFRIRWTPEGVIRETTGFNRAQWGVCQDNEGKIWFQGGASGLPSYFQFPIHYGNFKVEDELAEGFKVPWGAPMHLDDFQPGMQAVRQPDGSLNEVTGSAGNDIFRGHRLPAALLGQYFYGEPVARIVRQINPVVKEGITQLHNYYQDFKREFIVSTDPLFRPVDIATAPDGTMYIADMYHGIIQEGNWVQKGSYLRTKIDQYQMDKIVGLGRIWRLRYEGIERDTIRPRMGEESPVELLEHLSHPNGWWRDMAQQQLVHSRDNSVKGALEQIVANSENQLARYHALWTLEGLEILSPDLVKELFKDQDPDMRKMALRVCETLIKQGEKSLGKLCLEMTKDADYEVVMQALMTANFLEIEGWENATRSAIASYKERGVLLIGEQLLGREEEPGFFAASDFSPEEQNMIKEGATIYQELCATCHGINGTGTPSGGGLMAPGLANSPRVVDHPEYTIRVILRGLVGEIEGKNYTGGFMAPMHDEDDEWIASVVSFIRTNLGNDASPVTANQVAAIREATENDKPYTFETLNTIVTKQLTPTKDWIVTASHSGLARVGGTGIPFGAFTYEGWTSGQAQEKGMWFQVELPEEVVFSEIHFNSPPIRRGWRKDAPPPIPTYPHAYTIRISSDGTTWSDPVAQGSCNDKNVLIKLPPSEGRFIRITQTGEKQNEAPWKMESMKLFACASKEQS
ncbi:MAG: c-type cytochrome, partial [Saprospiraceae bacterium]|nr:c-type cytochrome [Saprospiraceae bacterium]